ncbi:MAG TPA: glycosyltransferase family 9 protein [Kofleriaceae bacterium]|nr:glycosyltransferase family 9 protein [Kofleriaceae bacterium]
MSRLNISDRRERALVAMADALLLPVAVARRLRARPAGPPKRILCFRLERIGDLLMIAPALAELRALAPHASIDLVVGSWNRSIAAAMPEIDRIETLDAAWLARGRAGTSPIGLAVQSARWWSRRYDLAINFEPDIRTNIAIAAVGARRTVGFASGGGGGLLDLALDYDPTSHTTDNARALVHAALGTTASAPVEWRLKIPEAHAIEAARLLAPFDGSKTVGIHVSGGRLIKQWPETRFREVAERLVHDRHAAIVLTGTPDDRTQINLVRAGLPPERVLDLSGGLDLLTVAAVIERLDLFVTGDTGPMHLANAVSTPIVAVFGPSDPARYAPRGPRDIVVRIDLPCSPCNRIRVPPARCAGHTPDCLAGIETASVLAAIDDVLRGNEG